MCHVGGLTKRPQTKIRQVDGKTRAMDTCVSATPNLEWRVELGWRSCGEMFRSRLTVSSVNPSSDLDEDCSVENVS